MRRLLFTVLLLFTASGVLAAGAPVRIDGGDTITAQSDVSVTTTATLVKASNTSRATLNCTTSQNVRWGDSAITTTKGQLVQANGSVAITNTGAIYMIAESSTATVSCTEESWASIGSSSGVFSP